MNQIILVFIGGGLGSLARLGVAKAFVRWPSVFPFGTLTANIMACFILGIFAGWAALKPAETVTSYRAFISIGFCGGFSTFSTFSNETVQLVMNSRFAEAFINVASSILFCFGATLLGMWVGR